MRSKVHLQAGKKTKQTSRGTIFEIDTVAAISCVPPVRPSLAISVMLKENDGKSWRRDREGKGLRAMNYTCDCGRAQS